MTDNTATPPTALPSLGRVGIWTTGLLFDVMPVADAQAIAREIEALGYGTLWFGDSYARESFVKASLLLGATSRLVAATGIAVIWTRHPANTGAAARALVDAFPGRFLLGLGASHAEIVDRMLGGHYEQPLTAMKRYLDGIDAAATRIDATLGAGRPRPPRVLAALGPKMLELARDRADGAHPYLTTPDHTARARDILGPGKLLAPEQPVVLSTDRDVVLRRARTHLARYLELPNYVNSWRRLGFTDADFQDGGSERLVDAVVAGGDAEAIRRRVAEHLDAGADHVCIQALGDGPLDLPRDQWRELAPALLG